MAKKKSKSTAHMNVTQSFRRKSVDFGSKLAALDLRMQIIDEHHLRRKVTRLEAIRRENPEQWRRLERYRLDKNREKSGLNRRLKAAGCAPVDLEPSLKRKLRKLQQLEARNRAETAIFRKTK